MNDQTLALAAVVAGALVTILSILISFGGYRRAAQQEAFRRAWMATAMRLAQRIAEEQDLSPEEARRLRNELEGLITADIGLLAEIDLRVDATVDKGDDPRTLPRTVEVQSQDGSRVDIRVDPTDADSVHNFVDTARRARAERVLAVH